MDPTSTVNSEPQAVYFTTGHSWPLAKANVHKFALSTLYRHNFLSGNRPCFGQ